MTSFLPFLPFPIISSIYPLHLPHHGGKYTSSVSYFIYFTPLLFPFPSFTALFRPSSQCVSSSVPPSALTSPVIVKHRSSFTSVPAAPPPPPPSSFALSSQCHTSAHILPVLHFFFGFVESGGSTSHQDFFPLLFYSFLNVPSQMKALFEEKGVQMKAKKQRQRKGRERERSGGESMQRGVLWELWCTL